VVRSLQCCTTERSAEASLPLRKQPSQRGFFKLLRRRCWAGPEPSPITLLDMQLGIMARLCYAYSFSGADMEVRLLIDIRYGRCRFRSFLVFAEAILFTAQMLQQLNSTQSDSSSLEGGGIRIKPITLLGYNIIQTLGHVYLEFWVIIFRNENILSLQFI
jgi:hypothetical protein